MKNKAQYTKINFSTEEAAAFLGVAKSELAAARCSGSLRGLTPPAFVRIGRTVRYPITSLEAWNESQPLFTTNAEAESSAT